MFSIQKPDILKNDEIFSVDDAGIADYYRKKKQLEMAKNNIEKVRKMIEEAKQEMRSFTD